LPPILHRFENDHVFSRPSATSTRHAACEAVDAGQAYPRHQAVE